MAGNNNETTTRFNVDISQLKKGIQDANRQIRLANAEFKAISSSMEDWENSTEGVSAKLQQLDSTLSSQRTVLKNLEDQYRAVAEEQGESSKGAEELKIKIANQQTAINKTEKSIGQYESKLEELDSENKNVGDSSIKASKDLKEIGNSAEQSEKKTSRLASALGGALKKGLTGLATATVGAIGGFLATGEATQEFTEDMGKLDTAFKTSGHTVETAKKSYEGMVGILGETDQAVEAVNHLAKLTKSEKELAKWTDISAGVYATFGDSLPIEGLTEASNETAKVGQVTGPLADALNWAGKSEEKFNEQLKKCNSESERASLITKTLTDIYGEAGKEYQKTNADLIASRKATSDFNSAMAEMGKLAMPIVSTIKQGFADLLKACIELIKNVDFSEVSEKIQSGFGYLIDTILPAIRDGVGWIIDNKDTLIGVIAGVGAGFVAWNVVTMIQGLIGAIKGVMLATEGVTIAQKLLNIVMNANPIGIIITLIAGLVTAFITLWNTSDEFRAFWINLWKKIKETTSTVCDAIVKFFKSAITKIKDTFKNIGSWFKDRYNDITNAFKNIGSWFSDKFKSAVTGVKNAFSSIGSWFKNKYTEITNVFKNIGSWFGEKFSQAMSNIKNKFSGWGKFWSGLWTQVKDKFSGIGTNIGNAIGGAVKSGINGVISMIERTINSAISLINGAITLINKAPGVNVGKVNKLNLPRLSDGGVLKRGEVGLLEGDGAEAVVPLHNNKKWIRATAKDLKQSLRNEGIIGATNNNVTNNYNFTQNNTSPKALNRLDIYRQTRNQFAMMRGY